MFEDHRTCLILIGFLYITTGCVMALLSDIFTCSPTSGSFGYNSKRGNVVEGFLVTLLWPILLMSMFFVFFNDTFIRKS